MLRASSEEVASLHEIYEKGGAKEVRVKPSVTARELQKDLSEDVTELTSRGVMRCRLADAACTYCVVHQNSISFGATLHTLSWTVALESP